jgi:hypothetical protein
MCNATREPATQRQSDCRCAPRLFGHAGLARQFPANRLNGTDNFFKTFHCIPKSPSFDSHLEATM